MELLWPDYIKNHAAVHSFLGLDNCGNLDPDGSALLADKRRYAIAKLAVNSAQEFFDPQPIIDDFVRKAAGRKPASHSRSRYAGAPHCTDERIALPRAYPLQAKRRLRADGI